MKILKVKVYVQTEGSEISCVDMPFDAFVAHVLACGQASGNWDEDRCDVLREHGAKVENYE